MNSIYYIQQRIKQQQDYIDKLDRDKKASDERYKELRENAEIIQRHWEAERAKKFTVNIACSFKSFEEIQKDMQKIDEIDKKLEQTFMDKCAEYCIKKMREDMVSLTDETQVK